MRFSIGFAVVLSACMPHAQLTSPRANMTPDERVAMFKVLRATSFETKTTDYCYTHYIRGPNCHPSSYDALVLGDNTEIQDPDDLLPEVPPDTDAAKAVRAYDRARRHWGGWGLAALASFAAGLAVMGTGGSEWDHHHALGIGLVIGGGALVVASPTTAIVASHHYKPLMTERLGGVYATYNDGLATALRVCYRDLSVVACDSPPPEQQPHDAPQEPTPVQEPTVDINTHKL